MLSFFQIENEKMRGLNLDTNDNVRRTNLRLDNAKRFEYIKKTVSNNNDDKI